MGKFVVLESLLEYNNTKEQTIYILFETLQMSEYLQREKLEHPSLNPIKTLDIMNWCPWNYSDMGCLACGDLLDIIDHFKVRPG